MVIFVLSLIMLSLIGCSSSRIEFSEENRQIIEWKKYYEDDFISYTKAFPMLDTSKNGIYLSYQMYFDGVEPNALLIFYDHMDILSCPFDKDHTCLPVKMDEDEFPYNALTQKIFSVGRNTECRDQIFGYEKLGINKKFFSLLGPNHCGEDSLLENLNYEDSQNRENEILFNYMSHLFTKTLILKKKSF